VQEYGVPVSRACKLIDIPRLHFYYESKKDDSEVKEAL
jgi:putative transposase